MYLFDTSVFIKAHRYDFPININPGTFWEFVEECGEKGEIQVPESVLKELSIRDDEVYKWVSDRKDIFIIPTEHALPYLRRVLVAYGIFTEADLEVFDGKADPFVVAEALASDATVVTDETSRPGATSVRKKQIPDICQNVDVRCIRYPRFLWDVSP